MLALLSFIESVYFSIYFELIDYAVLVASKEYQFDHITAVVWWHSDEHTVTQFLEQYKGTVVTVNLNNSLNFDDINYHDVTAYQQTVFFTEAPNEFEYFVKTINKIIIVSIRIIMILPDDNTYSVEDYTKIALENDIGDIIIVRKNSEGKIVLSTYKPYGNRYCSNNTVIDMKPDRMLDTSLFIRKYDNFYNCPIRVTAHEYMPYIIFKKKRNGILTELTGLDSYLLRIIFQKLNCSMNIVRTINYGLPNHFMDSSLESFTEFKNSNADIMIPSLALTANRYSVAQVANVHRYINIAWILPFRREILEWAKILLPFYNISTLYIIVAFFLIFFTLKIIIKFEKNEKGSQNAITFKMLCILLSQSVRKNSCNWRINCLLTFWVWFCMFIQIFYEGQLIEGLRKIILEPELRTIDDAVKSVKRLGGPIVLQKYYKNTSIGSKYEMIKLKDTEKCLKDMVDGKRFILMGDIFRLPGYGPALPVLKESVITLPTSFHMRPRWPAALTISRLTAQILESGMFAKIINDHIFEMLLRNHYQKLIKQEDSFKAINLWTFKSLLHGLIVMYVISAIVFIIEVLWNKHETKRRVERELMKEKKVTCGNCIQRV